MSKRRCLLEAGKTLLILALTCSALYLVSRSQLFHSLSSMLVRQPQEEGGVSAAVGQVQAAQPLRMAVMTEAGCHGVQYGAGDMETLFQRMAPLLSEALSSAGAPLVVTRQQWEQALLASPGVYFDFQGAVPMQVLSGWLSGKENPGLTARVRRLILAAGENEEVLLYYQDEETGRYFSHPAAVVSLERLRAAAAEAPANGAFFACGREHYSGLDPNTLISAQTPAPRVYAASNPLAGDEGERLTALLDALSFSPGITSVYSTPDGRRARSGNDTLSISNDGTVTFHSTDGGARYPAVLAEDGSGLFSGVECARQLVQAALGQWCGAARIYLSGVEQPDAASLQIEFFYALDGAAVQLGQQGFAARVTVSKGHITDFVLRLRSYAALEQTTDLLPERQAAAAMVQMGLAGGELQLCYQDGGDTVSAGWITRQGGAVNGQGVPSS